MIEKDYILFIFFDFLDVYQIQHQFDAFVYQAQKVNFVKKLHLLV
jgi:hypothetical protein